MEEEFITEELCVLADKLAQLGWCPGTSGNISVRIPGKDQIFAKISGRSMCGLKSSDLVKIDLEGKQLEGEVPPTKEWRFHTGIYRTRRDVNAVIHTHSTVATSFAIAGVELPILTTPGKAVLKRIPMVPYAPSGSEELARSVIAAFEDDSVRAVLLKGHGVVVVGSSLFEAWCMADWVEDAAKIAVLSKWILASPNTEG